MNDSNTLLNIDLSTHNLNKLQNINSYYTNNKWVTSKICDESDNLEKQRKCCADNGYQPEECDCFIDYTNHQIDEQLINNGLLDKTYINDYQTINNWVEDISNYFNLKNKKNTDVRSFKKLPEFFNITGSKLYTSPKIEKETIINKYHKSIKDIRFIEYIPIYNDDYNLKKKTILNIFNTFLVNSKDFDKNFNLEFINKLLVHLSDDDIKLSYNLDKNMKLINDTIIEIKTNIDDSTVEVKQPSNMKLEEQINICLVLFKFLLSTYDFSNLETEDQSQVEFKVQGQRIVQVQADDKAKSKLKRGQNVSQKIKIFEDKSRPNTASQVHYRNSQVNKRAGGHASSAQKLDDSISFQHNFKEFLSNFSFDKTEQNQILQTLITETNPKNYLINTELFKQINQTILSTTSDLIELPIINLEIPILFLYELYVITNKNFELFEKIIINYSIQFENFLIKKKNNLKYFIRIFKTCNNNKINSLTIDLNSINVNIPKFYINQQIIDIIEKISSVPIRGGKSQRNNRIVKYKSKIIKKKYTQNGGNLDILIIKSLFNYFQNINIDIYNDNTEFNKYINSSVEYNYTDFISTLTLSNTEIKKFKELPIGFIFQLYINITDFEKISIDKILLELEHFNIIKLFKMSIPVKENSDPTIIKSNYKLIPRELNSLIYSILYSLSDTFRKIGNDPQLLLSHIFRKQFLVYNIIHNDKLCSNDLNIKKLLSLDELKKGTIHKLCEILKLNIFIINNVDSKYFAEYTVSFKNTNKKVIVLFNKDYLNFYSVKLMLDLTLQNFLIDAAQINFFEYLSYLPELNCDSKYNLDTIIKVEDQYYKIIAINYNDKFKCEKLKIKIIMEEPRNKNYITNETDNLTFEENISEISELDIDNISDADDSDSVSISDRIYTINPSSV